MEQPLYVDEEERVIKCRCGNLFKGSIKLKYINQHTKRATYRIRERKRLRSDEGEELPDIRDFFLEHNCVLVCIVYAIYWIHVLTL